MRQAIEVKDPESLAMLARHDQSFAGEHTDLQSGLCACTRFVGTERPGDAASAASQPQRYSAVGADGGTCFACGGMTIRTGSCTECTNCFTSSGGCG